MLLIHLIGALIMFLNILISIFAILQNKKRLINFEKYFLAFNFCLQILSGLFLAISNQAGLVNTCAKLGIYLGAFLITEVILFKKLKTFEGVYKTPSN